MFSYLNVNQTTNLKNKRKLLTTLFSKKYTNYIWVLIVTCIIVLGKRSSNFLCIRSISISLDKTTTTKQKLWVKKVILSKSFFFFFFTWNSKAVEMTKPNFKCKFRIKNSLDNFVVLHSVCFYNELKNCQIQQKFIIKHLLVTTSISTASWFLIFHYFWITSLNSMRFVMLVNCCKIMSLLHFWKVITTIEKPSH